MYKYIFCDLDGTLFDDNKQISDLNLEAIYKARTAGVKFVVCTGRLPFCFVDYIKPLVSEDYVAANGSLVYFNGSDVASKYLEYKDSLRLLDYAMERNLRVRAFTSDYLYIVNGAHIGWSYKEQSDVSFDELKEIIKTRDIANVI